MELGWPHLLDSLTQTIIFTDKSQFDIGTIPRIFMQPNFDLRLLDTFNAVYPPNKPVPDDEFENPPRSPSQPKPQSTAKQLQEKVRSI